MEQNKQPFSSPLLWISIGGIVCAATVLGWITRPKISSKLRSVSIVISKFKSTKSLPVVLSKVQYRCNHRDRRSIQATILRCSIIKMITLNFRKIEIQYLFMRLINSEIIYPPFWHFTHTLS